MGNPDYVATCGCVYDLSREVLTKKCIVHEGFPDDERPIYILQEIESGAPVADEGFELRKEVLATLRDLDRKFVEDHGLETAMDRYKRSQQKRKENDDHDDAVRRWKR